MPLWNHESREPTPLFVAPRRRRRRLLAAGMPLAMFAAFFPLFHHP